jgi:hypothetical protein
MRTLLTVPLLCASLLFSPGSGSAQPAPVPEKSFEGAHHLQIEIKEVVPGGEPSSVEVIYFLKH